MATVRRWFQTMAINVCLLFNVAVVVRFFNVFPFPLCKAQLLGDWYENRRGAPKCSVSFFLFCPPIGDLYGTFYLTSLSIFCIWCAISNGAGGICAPIYWRTDVSLRQQAMLTKHGKPIMFRGFFFRVQSTIPIAAECFGAPIVLADYK